MDKKPGNNKTNELVNEAVRFPQVLLIGPSGEQLGVMSSREAQFKANEYELDLLCVAPNAQPPVCKILNYGKYRYEQQKKAKEAKKNQHVVEIKEVQLRPQIGIHDIETKLRASLGFLADGNKLKITLRFKGREMTHTEVGEETVNKFIASIGDAAIIEKKPALDGKTIIAVLAPAKKK